MGTGAITEYVDVAQLALYAFWILFFILVGYLHREGKREGWPLQMSSGELRTGVGGMPPPKTYRLAHGQGERVKPGPEPAQYEVNATPIYDASGAPMHPNGDPMVDGVGAAAWAIRPDKPDLTVDGRPRIVPLRVDSDHSVNSGDPDPRGQAVFGCDGKQAATVVDLWVDRAEPHFRYAELDAGGRRILLPMTLAMVSSDGSINVKSIRSDQFAQVPGLSNPDEVTLQEEDRITAFYGGGHLYAMPMRSEPLIWV
ncbi:MAG: photosynthetic reaction center subunit H [Proteobacteria bacterium]|jgi:photosynthetic reaction center H subunit|nr:photosynthetic reaction center subunit H [Luminiphilus sp.]MBL6820511.1 photosynthetic reaction center subunit H [Luminiphilus sp.]MDA0649829.1 photosynthetic reaction center subunit H [Pseudomonadota bacterium]